jgi:hypothetical protein
MFAGLIAAVFTPRYPRRYIGRHRLIRRSLLALPRWDD